METIERKLKSRVRTRHKPQTEALWLKKMNGLEEDLIQLGLLFKTAGFMLSEQKFSRLSQLHKNHSVLKAKMVEYFQDSKSSCYKLRQNPNRWQLAKCRELQVELEELSARLKKFKSSLFTSNASSYGRL